MSQGFSPPHGTKNATQRALGIAEIVGHIISFLSRLEQDYFEPETDLISAALVNKFWLAEALPVIWKTVWPHPMEDMFRPLKPNRRQFYANFVVSGTTRVFDDTHGPEDSPCDLSGIVFPRMTELLMFITVRNGECSLPDLNCPNLRRMVFDYRDGYHNTESDRLGAEDWESIFWDLPTKYPSLQELEFEHPPRLFPYALRRLKKRHPNLCDYLGKPKVRWITKFLPNGADESDGYDFEDFYGYPGEYDTDGSDMDGSTPLPGDFDFAG
ncbi:hypothetical protein N7471_005804 [Penicillium samsonianum]|uniref:uncharacterized protein n=1 Tax=Penicillium samsonianum TaxID=1882272 RepID=UPI0025477E51|nr:uncharacterized protein N7471_005804 [Penicillium samsonianum]KAJ6139318.1 hypothetical protein N7471_005804 [Penicillium samsonianum]